ncbi:sodium:proton antiporter, partial [Francisella tularensis subsp. holarctica]|nr:sodium:proton antiporter [Francisella tularensis subsp. holarctica]
TGIVLFVVLSNIDFFSSGGEFGQASNGHGIEYIWIIAKQICSEAGGGILLGYIFARVALLFLKTNQDSETSIFVTLAVA